MNNVNVSGIGSGLVSPTAIVDEEVVGEDSSVEQSEELVEAKSPLEELADILHGKNNAPSLIDLEGMKDLYGQIHASSVLGDENIYIWRTLKRGEYKSIAESGAMKYEDKYNDAVIRKCLLYPEPTINWFHAQDAGTIPTIFKQVMFKSGFVPEEMAMNMINTI